MNELIKLESSGYELPPTPRPRDPATPRPRQNRGGAFLFPLLFFQLRKLKEIRKKRKVDPVTVHSYFLKTRDGMGDSLATSATPRPRDPATPPLLFGFLHYPATPRPHDPTAPRPQPPPSSFGDGGQDLLPHYPTQPPGFSFRYPGVARVGGWNFFKSNFILKF